MTRDSLVILLPTEGRTSEPYYLINSPSLKYLISNNLH